MSPMGQGHATGGVPDPGYPAYYRRRAEGEVGLVMSGATAIPHPSAHMDLNEPHFYGDEPLSVWKRSVDAVHEAGGAHYPPALAFRSSRAGLCAADLGSARAIRRLVSRPATRWIGEPKRRNTRRADDPGRYRRRDPGLRRGGGTAQRLGFDGIEVHAAHGFLIDQFFWEKTNLRTDRYGGSLRDRTRFAVEILDEVRRRVGPDFPIFMRISQFKMMDYTAELADTPAALADFLEPLAGAGVDVFDCSIRRFQQPAFDGSHLNLAGWAKKLSGKAAMCCGGIGLGAGSLDFLGDANAYKATATSSLSELEALCGMLDRSEFDLVSLARAILGDAAWPAKVRQGREHELKPFTADLMLTLS